MSEEKEMNLIDRVLAFVENEENPDEAVDLVADLYLALSNIAAENAGLEVENSLLNRQLDIAERFIIKMTGGKGDNEPHLLS